MRILQDNLCISKMMLLKTDMFNNKPVQIYLEGTTIQIYYFCHFMMTSCHFTAHHFLSTVSLIHCVPQYKSVMLKQCLSPCRKKSLYFPY